MFLPHRDEEVGPSKLNTEISPLYLNDPHKFLFGHRSVGTQ